MHGYGVACFTAKCRRRTAAPRRSPFTYSTYPLQTLPPPFLFPLSPAVRRPLILRSFPPILVLALLRHPRRGFLSSVSLCLPFPRRAVASRAAFATRARTLFSPPRACIYRSHTRSSLAYRSRFPRCMPRCISLPWRALLGSRPRRQDPPDYTVCVFYEPRRTALASANARVDFRVALIALGAKCGMRGFSSSKHRCLPPVCFVSLAVTGDKQFPSAISHISRAYQGTDEGARFRIES